MKSLAIIGASGHGKVIAEIAELCGYTDIQFFDDKWPQLDDIAHWPVVGDVTSFRTANLSESGNKKDCVVAIGNNDTRMKIQASLVDIGVRFPVLLHPSATVSQYASLGAGTVVMAHAVVNPFSSLGDCCIVNTGATVDHDCLIGDGVHISPGANIAGGVSIGGSSWIGIGVAIKQNCVIGEDSIVGAGAVVVSEVPSHTTVIGVPAKAV